MTDDTYSNRLSDKPITEEAVDEMRKQLRRWVQEGMPVVRPWPVDPIPPPGWDPNG